MIAKEAGVDHPLLFYYFPNKANLFETILKELSNQYLQAMPSWYEGLLEMDVVNAISTYFERAIDFHLNQSQIIRIVFLDMAQSIGKDVSVPGYKYMKKISEIAFLMFRDRSRFNLTDEQKDIIINGLGQILISLIGARDYHAKIQGLNVNKKEYAEWVKKVMVNMTLPILSSLGGGETT